MALNTEKAQGVFDINCWIWILWESLSIDILIPSIHLFQLNGMDLGVLNWGSHETWLLMSKWNCNIHIAHGFVALSVSKYIWYL